MKKVECRYDRLNHSPTDWYKEYVTIENTFPGEWKTNKFPKINFNENFLAEIKKLDNAEKIENNIDLIKKVIIADSYGIQNRNPRIL